MFLGMELYWWMIIIVVVIVTLPLKMKFLRKLNNKKKNINGDEND
ncbi:hypothetical protein [Oceanirhabdus seepicola]|nr:hypothetical protein [Oceanirhabdus seepicola]